MATRSKKPKPALPPRRPQSQRARWRRPTGRLTGLLVAAALLAVFFFYVGGFQKFSNTLAGRAVARWDESAAASWLDWAEWWGGANAESSFYRARIARRGGRIDEMQSQLQLARRLGAPPQQLDKELLLANASVGQFPPGAVAELGQWLLDGDPDTRDICHAFSNGLAAAGRIEEAQEVLSAWDEAFPNDPRPQVRMGRIAEHRQDYDAAEEHYLTALRRDENHLPAAFSLGRMLTHQRRIDEAIAYYRQCLDTQSPVAAEIGLAVCLKATGEIEQAKHILREAVERDPQELIDSYRLFEESQDLALPFAELGKIEIDVGDYDAAVPLLERALELRPRDNVTRFSYATALRGQGRNELAEVEFEKVRIAREALAKATALTARIANDPTDVAARIELGKAHLDYDSENRGLYWLRTALTYDPKNQQTHRILADYFASLQGAEYARLAAEHRRLAEQDKPSHAPNRP